MKASISTLRKLEVLLVVTNIIGWVITLFYYYDVYTLGKNPFLCKANLGVIVINCARVAQSPYARVALIGGLEVPIALLAVIWFTTKALLSVYYILGLRRVLDVIIVLSALGTPLIPYLVYIELFKVHALCTYCTFLQSFIIITLIVAIELKLVERRLNQTGLSITSLKVPERS